MNHKIVLSYIVVIGFLICLVFAYVKYTDSTTETESDKLRQELISALEKEVSDIHNQIDDLKKSSGVTSNIDSNIENFIKNRPEIIATALENFYRDKTLKAQHQAVSENMDILMKDFQSGLIKTFAGKIDAPIKIIEFFDYSCGFCVKMLEANAKIIEQNSDVVMIFIELPMLGAESVEATRFATAVSVLDQTKYLQFQIQLFNSKLPKNRDNMMQIAANIGVDVLALQKILDSSDSMNKIEERIKANSIVFNNMKLRGTPSYIIGDEVFVGVIGVDKINEIILNKRNKLKK